MNFRKNLQDLILDAHKYQYVCISDTTEIIAKKRPLCFFTKIQWAFILISIIITIFSNKGFGENFAGYIISGLSLFVGIFFTFILTLYNKFENINWTSYSKNIDEEKNKFGIRLKNFFKKTTVLSLYSLIISIVCIFLLSISLLFTESASKEINVISMVQNISNVSFSEIFIAFLLLIYRSTVLYFLLDFILITVYMISSFYDFISSEYNNIKLS